jgi:hypothetical protein
LPTGFLPFCISTVESSGIPPVWQGEESGGQRAITNLRRQSIIVITDSQNNAIFKLSYKSLLTLLGKRVAGKSVRAIVVVSYIH